VQFCCPGLFYKVARFLQNRGSSMRVFLSWSGERSRAFASALRDWLPTVIQVIDPWMSSEDVEKGAPWFQQIGDGLGQAKGIGIFCVTPENMTAPWLNFEAGFLAATGGRARVCVALLGLEPAELSSPLNLFQATKVEESDFKRLVETLNLQTERPLAETVLHRAFITFWPQLEQALKDVSSQKPQSHKPKKRAVEDILGELVESNRRIETEVSYLRKRAPEVSPYGSGSVVVRPKPSAGMSADRQRLIEFLLATSADEPVPLDLLTPLATSNPKKRVKPVELGRAYEHARNLIHADMARKAGWSQGNDEEKSSEDEDL